MAGSGGDGADTITRSDALCQQCVVRAVLPAGIERWTMHPGLLHALILTALLLASAQPCEAYASIPLSNADMDTFVSGVAADWTSFTNGYVPPTLEFFADPDNFRTAPYSQGILDIDVIQAAGQDFGGGVWRSVGVTAADFDSAGRCRRRVRGNLHDRRREDVGLSDARWAFAGGERELAGDGRQSR